MLLIHRPERRDRYTARPHVYDHEKFEAEEERLEQGSVRCLRIPREEGEGQTGPPQGFLRGLHPGAQNL